MTLFLYFSCLIYKYFNRINLKAMIFKKLFTVSLAIGFVINCSAQRYIGAFSNDNKLWGFTEYNGTEVLSPKYVNPTMVSKSAGVAGVYVPSEKRFKLIDMKDEEIQTSLPSVITKIKFLEDEDSKSSNEYFLVMANNKWGVLDGSGKILFNPIYDKISDFSNGFAIASIGAVWFVLNNEGKEVQLQGQFKAIKKFSEGLAAFTSLDARCGFIDEKGNIAIQSKFKATGHFSNGLAWVRNFDDKLGYINKSGDFAIQAKYTLVTEFDPISDRATAKIEKQSLILKTDGTEIITSVNTVIKKFVGGAAMAQEAGRWGFVDKDGKWLVNAKYEAIKNFSEGIALVRLGGLWGAVDKTGKTLIEPTYESMTDFKNGFSNIKKGGKWGVVDSSGKVVCEPKFMGLKEFQP